MGEKHHASDILQILTCKKKKGFAYSQHDDSKLM